MNRNNQTKTIIPIDKNSLHYKIVKYSFLYPKLSILLIFTFAFVFLCLIYLSLIPKKTSNEYNYIASTPSNNNVNSNWTLISTKQISDKERCNRYRKSNGSEINSCYILNNKNEWIWFTSF